MCEKNARSPHEHHGFTPRPPNLNVEAAWVDHIEVVQDRAFISHGATTQVRRHIANIEIGGEGGQRFAWPSRRAFISHIPD